MLRVNVTCSYNIVVEEHELERCCSHAEANGTCEQCGRDNRPVAGTDHEDWDGFDSDQDSTATSDLGGDDALSLRSESEHSMAIVPYGAEPRTPRHGRRSNRRPTADTPRNDELSVEGADSTEGEGSVVANDRQGHSTRGRRASGRPRHDRQHHCIQGEVVLGQPTVMYRTQPQELSGPAAAAASAAAAAVAAASGPSQRIVVQAAARAAAAAAANSAAQQMGQEQSSSQAAVPSSAATDVLDMMDPHVHRHPHRRHRHSLPLDSDALSTTGDASPRESSGNTTEDTAMQEFLLEQDGSLGRLHRGSDAGDSNSHLLSSHGQSIRYGGDGQDDPTSSNYPASGQFQGSVDGSSRPSLFFNPPADLSGRQHSHNRGNIQNGMDDTNDGGVHAPYGDFWDMLGIAPQNAMPTQSLPASRSSMDTVERYLEADLAALQEEASIIQQLRHSEAIRQQMTLPEDIAQAGPGAATTAVLAGGRKCLFGRTAEERVPLIRTQTPLHGRRAGLISPAHGSRVSTVSASFDGVLAGAVSGSPQTAPRTAYTPLDTPHLLEMRDGAEVLIVNPIDPTAADVEVSSGSESAAPLRRVSSASARTPQDGRQLLRSRTETRSRIRKVSGGPQQPLGHGPINLAARAGRRQQQENEGTALDPKMVGSGLHRSHPSGPPPRVRESEPKLSASQRGSVLSGALRLEPRAPAAQRQARGPSISGVSGSSLVRGATDVSSSWQQESRQPANTTHNLSLQLGMAAAQPGHTNSQQSRPVAGPRRRVLPQAAQARGSGLNISGHATRTSLDSTSFAGRR